MRSLEQSAKPPGTADFDLIYIHDVDRFTHGDAYERRFNEAIEGCYRALDDLRKAGHIKAIGVGVNESDIATRFIRACSLDAVMMAGRYTLLDRGARADLSAGGQASGHGDCRRRRLQLWDTCDRAWQPPGRPSTMARLQKTSWPVPKGSKRCAIGYGVPLQAAAIQFPFRNPLASAVVLGMSRPERVAENLAWSRQAIPEDLWSEIDRLFPSAATTSV